MARKLLTAIDQQVARATITVQQIARQTAIQEIARQTTVQEWLLSKHYEFVKWSHARHIQIQHMTSLIKAVTVIPPPPERQQAISSILHIPTEERELLTKKQMLPKEEQEQAILQRDITRLEKWLQETQERLITPIALNLIDHTVLCMLDKLLWETNPTIVSQITQQLVEMCEKKTSRIRPIAEHEALQKHMLQLYVPFFSTFPFSLNIFALRLTSLTRPSLLGKSMTLYYLGACQAQAMKQKYQLQCCENRRLETKCVSSGKPPTDAVPEKFSIGWTRNLTEEEKVGLIRDMKGKEFPFMVLRYAYKMPYWIRRFVAIHMGYPENAKYALYFGIGGLPTRRSTWRYDFLKYPEAKYLTYHADQHVRNLIMKIQSKRGHFIERYGKYYRRRRI